MNRRSFLISAMLATGAKALRLNASAEPIKVPLSSLHPRFVNFEHGVSAHSRRDLAYLVANRYSKFRARIGVDAAPPDSEQVIATFQAFADGKKLFDSGVMKHETPVRFVDVDISNVNILRLVIIYGDWYIGPADWADAELIANPRYIPTPSPRVSEAARRIRSGELVFTAGGSTLTGLELGNGKRINLQASTGLGPYYAKPDAAASIKISADFDSAPGGLAWNWECWSKSHKPWTAPVDTVFKWPNPEHAKVWLPWGRGKQWQDPLVPQPLEDKTHEYGAYFNRPDGVSLPMATILDQDAGIGVTIIQSPEDVLLDMQISTTKDGEIRFSRAFHRFGGESSKVAFHMDIVVHEPDVRAALRAIVERYPKYFDPVPLAHQVGGGAAYSKWEGDLDARKLAAMSFSWNWKASVDFPYMGVFLPPVSDDEKWNRFAGGGGGDHGPADEGKFGQTSIRQMSAYSTAMRARGFHVLNYFNATEFGTNIVYPPPPQKAQSDADLWKDANDQLHTKLESGVLKIPDPIWTWGMGVIMDCADPVYRSFLLEQARRHIEKIPDSSGICIDRMDWLTHYNPNADDGVTWIDGPYRHLRRSWISLMEQIGSMMHAAGKVVFSNDMDRRLELMRHVDGFYDEHAYHPYSLNASAFLALRKPLVCWTNDDDTLKPDPDVYFQRHLYLGSFLTVPVRGNDHSIAPDEWNEKLYLDYGPLFNALKGRTWVLRPGVVQVKDDTATANVFETPAHHAVFVGLARERQNVQVALSGLSDKAKVLHPGETGEIVLQATEEASSAVFDVPLKRGCAMLILDKQTT